MTEDLNSLFSGVDDKNLKEDYPEPNKNKKRWKLPLIIGLSSISLILGGVLVSKLLENNETERIRLEQKKKRESETEIIER